MIAARMRKRWRNANTLDPQATDRLAAALRVHPLIAQLLMLRGVDSPDRCQRFLQPSMRDLTDPAMIPGVTAAARRICKAIDDRQPIVVYGDYDVDGVTAASILWHMLAQLGGQASIYIPHRIDEGYGLNAAALEQLATENKDAPPLIVTVDCGITAVEPAARARELGVDLIITDHHHFDPAALPDALALVHPGLPRESDPDVLPADEQQLQSCKNLCGAGVAYKLAWQVARQRCGSDRLPDAQRKLMIDLLSLVALGTVADVVPLTDENRVLTIFGLQRIRESPFAGVRALIDASHLDDPEKVSAYDVGFKLGPRLNACGRMGHAERAAHLLTQADPAEAASIAAFLTKENDRRRATEREIFQQAREMVLESDYASDDRRAIVLGKDDWHPGVIGIVASRLVEAFCRPVVMLSIQNGSATGSARSVDGVSIHDAIAACAELLDRFGGHAMAAGLGLPTDRIDAFRDALVAEVNTKLPAEHLAPIVDIDAELPLRECRYELFEQIQKLAPFGRGNAAPTLAVRDVALAEPARRIGKSGDHLSLSLRDAGGCWMRAVAFGMGDLADDLPAGVRLDVAFEPKTSVWQGRARAEMHVRDLRVRE